MPYLFALLSALLFLPLATRGENRPNILLCISDDQSYESTGANGDSVVRTPAFDRIATECGKGVGPCIRAKCGLAFEIPRGGLVAARKRSHRPEPSGASTTLHICTD